MLTPGDLEHFIETNGIDALLMREIGHTPTVPAAAQALGVSTEQIIKTLIFFVSGESYAVITNGMAPIPARPLADHFGVGKRQIKLAKAAQVLELSGYPVGGVPPFGHRSNSPVLLDRTVLSWETVYGGGGDDQTMMKIRSKELLRVTNATIVDLTSEPGSA